MNREREDRVALFAGSFDPFTRGHAALVDAALRLFDRVVIGVGSNISKSALLTAEQRCDLIEECYADDARVCVAVYDALTVDFARSIGACALVRGVRGVGDLECEQTLETVNRSLAPEIQTLLLLTPAEVSHISSSCVRELLAYGKYREVSLMMPEGVDIKKYIL